MLKLSLPLLLLRVAESKDAIARPAGPLPITNTSHVSSYRVWGLPSFASFAPMNILVSIEA